MYTYAIKGKNSGAYEIVGNGKHIPIFESIREARKSFNKNYKKLGLELLILDIENLIRNSAISKEHLFEAEKEY